MEKQNGNTPPKGKPQKAVEVEFVPLGELKKAVKKMLNAPPVNEPQEPPGISMRLETTKKNSPSD